MLRNTLKKVLLMSTFAMSTTTSIAQELIVGIEPFPPVFDENGKGLGSELLDHIAKNSDLSFQLQVMTYARAKKELKNERMDIIGLIPKGLETQEFYQYGLELDWSFENHVDIYSTDKKYLTIENIPTNSLGTLVGNAAFFSEALNIPLDKFIEVASLEQLIKMLKKQRIKAVLFERISTMSSINKYLAGTIYYRFIQEIPATFAVSNTPKGQQLKEKIDYYIRQIETKKDFQRGDIYNNLPPQGEVPYLNKNSIPIKKSADCIKQGTIKPAV